MLIEISKLGLASYKGGGVLFLPAEARAALAQDIVTVSMFGDSITAGSFNYPNAPDVWPPQRLNRLVDERGRSTVTGANLAASINTGTGSASAGATFSGGVWTLAGSAGDNNPRFVGGHVPVADDKLYRLALEINNDESAAQLTTARWLGTNGSATTVFDVYFGGPNGAQGGYVPKSAVVSGKFIRSRATGTTSIRYGAALGPATAGVGRVRNFAMHEVTRGAAVHNQGISGETSAQGLARIATVTNWTPTVSFVAFGTNDLRNGIALAAYLANTEDTAEALVAGGVHPVLATLPPLAADQPNYDQVPTWNAAIIDLAKSLGLGWWDRWKALGNGNLDYIGDGRHPNEAGYDRLVNSLLPALV